MYSPHPVFQSPSDSALIWRYLDLAKYLNLLSKRSLYFARPSRLGDRFEGSLTAGNQASIERTIASVPVEQREAVRAGIAENTREGLRSLGVNCWHLGDYESAAMWRLYVRGNQGLALQSTFARLRQSLGASPLEVHIGKVNYIDYEKETFPEDNMFWQFLHKRRSFEYERELRAIIWEPRWGTWKVRDQGEVPGINLEVDLETLLERVYVSPTSPQWFEDLVRSTSLQYGVQCDVLKSDLDKDPIF
jgi:hypothetical protein